MDCRDFREKHVAYVDDTLPAVEMEAMHRHARSCYRCSRHDTAVRRGLLLVHNLPQSEPSALAAGLTLFGYVALETAHYFGTPEALVLPPVVATAPALPAPTPTGSAYMAGISTGMPIWPAVMMMDEAPRRMADVELQQASLR